MRVKLMIGGEIFSLSFHLSASDATDEGKLLQQQPQKSINKERTVRGDAFDSERVTFKRRASGID